MTVAHPSESADYIVGSSGSTASSLSFSALGGRIRTVPGSRYFQDQYGRRLLLHGCSLSGLNKLPTKPNGFTHLREGFFQHETVDFVGRPFPLEEAPEHFARLRQWGHTFIRLVVTWESLEHEGPGIYDMKYIDYLHSLISMMPDFGLVCYIDAHQDVWSRHTGGSGAPTWTLPLVGFDLHNLKATGAAHAHNLHLAPDDPPPRVWPSGYQKLAASTMATVFWAGNTFAPKRRVKRNFHKAKLFGEEGEIGVQDFLQASMIEAFGQLADRVRECEALIGFEVMNEPHRGYIQLASQFGWNFNTDLHIGYVPTPIQSFALGSGHPVIIHHYGKSFPVSAVTHSVLLVPPKHRTAWLEGSDCIWAQHGVWAWDPKKGELGEAVPLRLDYFQRHPVTGKEISWEKDFYFPFCQNFGARMKKVNSNWFTFAETIPNEFCPDWPKELRPHNLIYAPHWYDLQSLFEKALGFMSANVQGLSRGMFFAFALYFGRRGLKKNYSLQIRNITEAGYRQLGEFPVVIGETGCPMDLNSGKAFETGNWEWQERQLDAICSAMEDSLVSYNLWNYNPLNRNEYGDAWCGENFSWFSLSDMSEHKLKAASLEGEDERLNVGARCLDAIERPYASKVAGIPIKTSFDMFTLRFSLTYANPSLRTPSADCDKSAATTRNPPLSGNSVHARETEIYLPRRRYKQAHSKGTLIVKTKDVQATWKYCVQTQTLFVLHTNTEPGYTHEINVSVANNNQRREMVLFLLAGVTLVVAIFLASL